MTLLTISVLLASCEGFEALTIHNTLDYEAKVTIRPGNEHFDKSQIHNYSNNQVLDSSMTIHSIFTRMMFNVKIKEREIRTYYVKIETQTDPVIADSREEITELIYARRKGITNEKGSILTKIVIV